MLLPSRYAVFALDRRVTPWRPSRAEAMADALQRGYASPDEHWPERTFMTVPYAIRSTGSAR